MNVIYQGWPGTGLRLESLDGKKVVDVSGGHGKTAPMTLFVANDIHDMATVELEPKDVMQLLKFCAEWLVWHDNGRSTRA